MAFSEGRAPCLELPTQRRQLRRHGLVVLADLGLRRLALRAARRLRVALEPRAPKRRLQRRDLGGGGSRRGQGGRG
jgi:hypothetical protein